MYGAIWKVTVLRGESLESDLVDAPMVMNEAPSVFLGQEGAGDPVHLISYGPVTLRGDQGSISVQVSDERAGPDGRRLISFEDVRTMERPTFEFTHFGTIRVEGFEYRSDGALVGASWEIDPFRPEDSDG